jgi:predicted O-linked N-acetylglucosamine transferase (SPINDLY family)
MGVPVVTRVGGTSVGRAGLSQLFQLGQLDLAAESDDAFVGIAVDLANDLGRLAQLRSGLRSRMQRSALMDAARFARQIEGAYRTAWKTLGTQA